jgi:hypothetical protein
LLHLLPPSLDSADERLHFERHADQARLLSPDPGMSA